MKRKRLRWIDHVLRKPPIDMTRVALRWTPEGKQKQGGPNRTWSRTVDAELEDMGPKNTS